MSTDAATARSTEGILEVHPDGFGFVRNLSVHCAAGPQDPYVPADLIRRFGLRGGEIVTGLVQAETESRQSNPRPRNNGRNGRNNNRNGRDNGRGGRTRGPRLKELTGIEGRSPDGQATPAAFDTLTPVDPTSHLRLETGQQPLTTRVIDMFTPIGKGQRGLIVAPPRSGKTILVQHIAEGISRNHPDVELIVLLVDERPEEVTEMRASIDGTVFASSNDRETVDHVRLARLVIERAKRLVESGRDVVVLLDSITRLARAYNKHVGTTGRTMSGGLDVKALDIPKRLFGSARAIDGGGSLTTIATALIETGSRMDDVIFQEFKGTGNMELVLDRRLAERRIFPAIDVFGSGTRKEERLLPSEQLERINLLRRSMSKLNSMEAIETLLRKMEETESNEQFLESVEKFRR